MWLYLLSSHKIFNKQFSQHILWYVAFYYICSIVKLLLYIIWWPGKTARERKENYIIENMCKILYRRLSFETPTSSQIKMWRLSISHEYFLAYAHATTSYNLNLTLSLHLNLVSWIFFTFLSFYKCY